VLNIVTF